MARILFVMNIFPGPGGLESVTGNLIEALSKDNDIYVLAYCRTEGLELPAGVKEAFYFTGESREVNISFYNDIVAGKNITHVINQGMYPILSEVIFNPQADSVVKVISVLHGMPGYERREYWCLDRIRKSGAARLAGRRIMKWFGLNRSYNRYVGSYKSAYRAAMKGSYRIVLLCDNYIREFCRIYGFEDNENKIVAIPNPLPASYSGIPEPDFGGKENLIIFVGRLSAEKNVSLMLDTWKLLYRRLPGWKFQIIGDGPMRRELEHQSDGLCNVEFEGYTLSPQNYYRKAKILLLASEYEGYPMSLIEAQRFGTVPVACPSGKGVESILENGGGVLVPEPKPEVMARTISGLVTDEERLKSLSLSVYRKSDANKISGIADKWRRLLE